MIDHRFDKSGIIEVDLLGKFFNEINYLTGEVVGF